MLQLIAPPLLCMLMGFAMQRGSTCCLAAVYELLHAKNGARLISIAEASLWVIAISGLAEALGLAVGWPKLGTLTLATVAGGVLLGIAACVNGACVLGSVARIGAGEWAYLWTPVGFFAACVAAAALNVQPRQEVLPPWPADTRTVAAVCALTVALAVIAWRMRRRSPTPTPVVGPYAWSPHAATIVIGIAFAALLVIAGEWSYTKVLDAAARNTEMRLAERGLWCASLVAGSILGGASAGLLKPTWPTWRAQVGCFLGGALFGLGSLMVPGGNDALILLGVPMLSASAWAAAAAMFAAMAIAVTIHLRTASHS